VIILFSLLETVGAHVHGWAAEAGQLERAIGDLAGVSAGWVYAVLAVGGAVENFFPPIPADTFVLLGALLAAEGEVTLRGVFAVTWSSNTIAALLNYAAARRWGRGVLDTRLGRWFIRPRQLERVATLYHGHGGKIIFFSRFLPAFRVVVPVFAGISRLSFWRTALPIALASAVWYGLLVLAGGVFGPVIVEVVGHVNVALLAIAGLLAGLVTALWWRTRRHVRHGVERPEREGG
jgi:membrane protein DedA with SNARE-associated domain